MLHIPEQFWLAAISMRRRSAAVFILLFVLALNIHVIAYARSSFTVVLVDGNKRIPCHAAIGETVGEFLTRLEKLPGEHDTLNFELDDPFTAEDEIRITRNTYETVRETTAVPFDTVYSHSPELTPGEENVSVEGDNGTSEFTYEIFSVNGDVVEKTLISEQIIKQPVTKQVEIGFRSIPVSKLDFDAEFDENHEPLSYTVVLRDQRSSGYWAPEGAGTASGLVKADVGHVAVNPNVIPYGSKLFIQSSDGSYIYGYAIAADTGTALMDGRVAVDCFYGTYQESADHGIKTVDIFVLE